MSIVRCNYCDKNIDTEQDAEHFAPGTEHCLIQVQNAAPALLEALEAIVGKNKEQLNQLAKMASKSSTITFSEIDSIFIILAIQAIKKATKN